MNAVEKPAASFWPLGATTSPWVPTPTLPARRGRYRLTRGIIEVLGEARNEFSILTKSPMVVRDPTCSLPQPAAPASAATSSWNGRRRLAGQRAGTPPPRQRIEAVRRLNQAGIPCGVLVAPDPSGHSDDPDRLRPSRRVVPPVPSRITPIFLHLRPGVATFMPWLAGYRPDLVERYRALRRLVRVAVAARTSQS